MAIEIVEIRHVALDRGYIFPICFSPLPTRLHDAL
jgi:hypothetical protein